MEDKINKTDTKTKLFGEEFVKNNKDNFYLLLKIRYSTFVNIWTMIKNHFKSYIIRKKNK